MNTLAFARLLLVHDRGSLLRLLGIACSVAVGTALFLTLWGFAQGITTRTERATWADYYPVDGQQASQWAGELPDDHIIIAGSSASFYSTLNDRFMDQKIHVVEIAATANSTFALPGMERAPAPGTYLASPALAELIAQNPAEVLGARYGEPVGIIGDAALGSPDSLLAVRGATIEEMRQRPDAMLVSSLTGRPFATSNFQIIAIIGSIAVLMPVLLLIAIITRLGSAQRSEMFASLRLIGATPAQIAQISMLEIGTTSLVGALAGALLAWATSPLFSAIQIDNDRFFLADIQPSPPFVLVVALLITAATTLVAWFRGLRCQSTGLGSSPQVTERRPSLWRVVPMFFGMAALLVAVGNHFAAEFLSSSGIGEVLLIGGFATVLLGLVFAGPTLTWWASRLASRLSHKAAGVIASARIVQHPRMTFRAVGGLVVAVFVVTFFFAAVTTVAKDAQDAGFSDSVAQVGLGRAEISGASNASAGESDNSVVSPTADLLIGSLADNYISVEINAAREQLAAVPAVTGTALAYYNDNASDPDGEWVTLAAEDVAVLGILPSEVPNTPWIEAPANSLPGSVRLEDGETVATTVRAAQVSDVEKLRPGSLFVAYDDNPLARERVRTAMLTLPLRYYGAPQTVAERNDDSWTSAFTREYAYLANLGVIIATVISGISMAVSTVSSILDRRRTLALMRLMGMPHTAIRRMILTETLLPLLAVFLLSVVLGFAVAQLLLAGLTGGRRFVVFELIDPAYFVVLGISLLLAAAAILATFPTARRTTALAATRFE
jgi:cell division protein FtsX